MLSIQIDTKSLELVICHQFNNIKLSFFAIHMKLSFPLCMFDRCCTIIRYSRALPTVALQVQQTHKSSRRLHFLMMPKNELTKLT